MSKSSIFRIVSTEIFIQLEEPRSELNFTEICPFLSEKNGKGATFRNCVSIYVIFNTFLFAFEDNLKN